MGVTKCFLGLRRTALLSAEGKKYFGFDGDFNILSLTDNPDSSVFYSGTRQPLLFMPASLFRWTE
jgi:hypothetical protein